MALYIPNVSAAEAIAQAVRTGETVTLTEAQANEIYSALREARNRWPEPKLCPHGYPQTVRCSRCGE